jgi:hypothetical protein
MKRLIDYFSTIRNKKFNHDLETVQDIANNLHNQKSNAVVCIYCGKLLDKKESAIVYDITNNVMEYSHEDCWEANNEVSDEMPIPKKKI